MKISEHVRAATLGSRMSQAELSRRSGIDPANLSRFVSGQGGLSLSALDALGEALDVVILGAEDWQPRERIWKLYRQGIIRRCDPPSEPHGQGTNG
jgi:transcriptional regulator with XRE-family HTH domain